MTSSMRPKPSGLMLTLNCLCGLSWCRRSLYISACGGGALKGRAGCNALKGSSDGGNPPAALHVLGPAVPTETVELAAGLAVALGMHRPLPQAEQRGAVAAASQKCRQWVRWRATVLAVP